jgi:hypothetical protein
LPGRYKGKKKGLASSAGRREGGEEEEEEGVLSSFLGRQTPGNRREEGRSMKEVNASCLDRKPDLMVLMISSKSRFHSLNEQARIWPCRIPPTTTPALDSLLQISYTTDTSWLTLVRASPFSSLNQLGTER